MWPSVRVWWGAKRARKFCQPAGSRRGSSWGTAFWTHRDRTPARRPTHGRWTALDAATSPGERCRARGRGQGANSSIQGQKGSRGSGEKLGLTCDFRGPERPPAPFLPSPSPDSWGRVELTQSSAAWVCTVAMQSSSERFGAFHTQFMAMSKLGRTRSIRSLLRKAGLVANPASGRGV